MIPIISKDIVDYNKTLASQDIEITEILSTIITSILQNATNKIWHRHPVWFLDGNPIVGYSKQKKGIRLMFWSGVDFEEEALNVKGEKFKDASIFYNSADEIIIEDVKRWLEKSKVIQWDYKNIIKRKGILERIW